MKTDVNNRFDGKIVLIFGGAKDLGRKLVESFSSNGANVIFADTDKNEAAKIVNKNIDFIECDICNGNQVKETVDKVIKKHKKIDVLINNIRGPPEVKDSFDYSIEEWMDKLKIILGGVFTSTKYVLKHMIKAKKGVILNIASISAKYIGDESVEYHVAKAGLIQFTKYVAHKYGKYNIRANTISPGFIVKDKHMDKFNSAKNKNYKEFTLLCHPLRKIGTLQDMINLALFLCSDEASFITGEDIVIDGGLTINDPWALVSKIKKF